MGWFLRGVALAAMGSLGCNGGSLDKRCPGGPPLVDHSEVVVPGGVAWIRARTAVFDLEVRLDGQLLPPVWQAAEQDAAVYRLPEELPLGEFALGVGPHGGREDVCAVVEVVDPWFEDAANATGLVHRQDVSAADPECSEALTGVGFADVDGDGDADAFVGNHSRDSQFFRNEGGRFVDQTEEIGLSGIDRVSGVSFADVDNDGDPDLFVGRRGGNRFLRNENGTFVEASERSRLGGIDSRTMGAGWGDFDGDGDLDLYEVNHSWCFPGVTPAGRADRLLRNENGTFVDVTDLLDNRDGEVTRRLGFTALWLDHNRDGALDLFVVQDDVFSGAESSNVLWRNDGDSFTAVSRATGWHRAVDPLGKPLHAMGTDVADLNHDGRPDFLLSNIGHNMLLLSAERAGRPVYVDHSRASGVGRATLPWGRESITWGAAMLDIDNDADVDLFLVGGALKGDDPQPHALLVNQGNGTFVDRTWRSGLAEVGHGKAVAVVDLDEDGFLDLVVANWGGELEVHRNRLGEEFDHHWLIVDLEGDGETVPRDPFGAEVALTTPDGLTQTCWFTPRPTLSATGLRGCHFGLGTQDEVVGLEVRWPNGQVTTAEVSEVDQRIKLGFSAPE